jgi:hypothetical protein
MTHILVIICGLAIGLFLVLLCVQGDKENDDSLKKVAWIGFGVLAVLALIWGGISD